MRRIAAETSTVVQGARALPVCLCHTHFSTVLAPRLFAFAIWDFDLDGTPRDPVSVGHEVRYAVIVNLPIPLQLETCLVFLMQLLYRQSVLSDIQRRQEPLEAFHVRLPQADAQAKAEILDRLHYGWLAAAEAIRVKAKEAGFSLEVRYEPDAIPDRRTQVRRLPSLARIYNEMQLAREMVDKIVSMIGGQSPRISAPQAPLAVRVFLEDRLAASNVRYYMNQTVRDAEVYGNGFFLTGDEPEEFSFRNLRPHEVEVRPNGFWLVTPSGQEPVRGHVLHIRGIDQIVSPYGISLFEVLVPSLVQSDVARRGQEFASQVLSRSDIGPEIRARAEESLQFSQEMLGRVDESMAALLWFPRDHLPAPVPDLYFPGQERLEPGSTSL